MILYCSFGMKQESKLKSFYVNTINNCIFYKSFSTDLGFHYKLYTLPLMEIFNVLNPTPKIYFSEKDVSICILPTFLTFFTNNQVLFWLLKPKMSSTPGVHNHNSLLPIFQMPIKIQNGNTSIVCFLFFFISLENRGKNADNPGC